MHEQCLVAVYPSRNEAEQAFRAARGSGVPSHNIRMSGADTNMDRPHAWDWLFSDHVPEREKAYFRTHLTKGRTALSVLIDGGASSAKIDEVEEILDRFHPLDVRVEEEEGSSAAGAGGGRTKKGGKKASSARGEEETIPLPREEPKVGAMATDRVRHIRTYVVEEPFERQVSLHDERLVVERRAAADEEGGEISEEEYEFHERHEEPIVEMTTRTDEELVIRKEPTQHTEVVRGTTRRTEAEIEEGEAGEGRASSPSERPASRSTAPSQPPASMKGRS